MARSSAAKQYSIAEARDNLAAIVHEAEAGRPIELTRRGKRVAVLLSAENYERLALGRRTFWEALQQFRASTDLEALEPDPWADVRDRSPGRDFDW